MYMIYTVMNGSRNNFKCKGYNVSDGYIEFWNPELTKHYFVSIHKMDYVMIEEIAGDSKKEKEDDIRV